MSTPLITPFKSTKPTPLVRQVLQKKPEIATPRLDRRQENVQKESNLGLKQREKKLDDLQKENMNLKLNIFYLHEHLEKLAPDDFNEFIKDVRCPVTFH